MRHHLLASLVVCIAALASPAFGAEYTLSQALDTNGLVWVTGGGASWTAQTSVSRDGIAAESGAITNTQETWIETTIQGPGTLTFWWRVSCETNYDRVEFHIDSIIPKAISGETPWLQESHFLGPGPHTLRWIYLKDDDTASGQDRAWLDSVNFQSAPTSPPLITTQPTNQVMGVGGSVSFVVLASGAPDPAYLWHFNYKALPNATNNVLNLPFLSLTNAGDYFVIVSNSVGVLTSSIVQLKVICLLEGVDAPSLAWQTGGSKPWFTQLGVSHDGIDAAVSGRISASQNSWMRTTIDGPGTLSFWWKVSCEPLDSFGGDSLSLAIDELVQTNISGEVDWQFQTVPVPPGLHDVTWQYLKDASFDLGLDKAWVDQITYVKDPLEIVLTNNPGVCGALHTFTPPAGTDACAAITTEQIAGLTSDSVFPVGVTTNVFRLSNLAGDNATNTSWVRVLDLELPLIICPFDIAVANDPGKCGAVVTYAPLASDNCPALTTNLLSGLPSGSFFPVGITTNTLQVADASGNSATCSFTVQVLDTESPVIFGPDSFSVPTDPGGCDSLIAYELFALDNCPGVSTSQIAGIENWGFYPVGPTTNIYLATDSAGNTSTYSFVVTVYDAETPQLLCPTDITVSNELGHCDAIVTFQPPIGRDNCPGAATTQLQGLASGSRFPVGVTTNIFQVVDAAGNSSSCSFVVQVLDAEAPRLVCPPDYTLSTDFGICEALVAYDITPTDNCSVRPLLQLQGLASGDMFPIGSTTNTWQAMDLAGNSATCSFVVNIIDTEAPELYCPVDLVLTNEPGKCGAVALYEPPEAVDNCVGVTMAQIAGLPSGSLFPVGITTNTFKVTDAAGNSTTDSCLVRVVDKDLPQLLCPSDITATNEPGLCGAIVYFEVPAGTDNCPWIRISQTGGLPSGAFFPVGSTTNQFKAVDAAGNSVTCTFVVKIVNSEPPVITCPPDITITNEQGQCGSVVHYSLTTAHVCTGTVMFQTAGLTNGSLFPVGFTTNHFQLTDADGTTASCSFVVQVIDAEAPQLLCPADIILTNESGFCGAVALFLPPQPADNCPEALVTQTTGLPSGSFYPVGVTTNIFTATDQAGNTTACSFLVTVIDSEMPELVCPPDLVHTNDPGACDAIVPFEITRRDNCPGGVFTQTAGLPSGAGFPAGVTTNQFELTDASGNTTQCSFTVRILDTELPQIACPPDLIVTNEPSLCGATVSFPEPVLADNCASPTLIQTSGLTNGSVFPVGSTTNSFQVVDASGNTASCSFIVTVIDAEAPQLLCPIDITLTNDPGQCGAVAQFQRLTATDNCQEIIPAQLAGLPAGSIFPVGVTTNVFEALDVSGNRTSCSFVVTVMDIELPNIICPADITVTNEPGSCGVVVYFEAPFSSDNCAPASTSQLAGLSSGSVFPIGSTTNIFQVMDAAGNSATCALIIKVVDLQGPQVSCPADIAVPNDPGQCGAIVDFAAPTGTDNCPGIITQQVGGLPDGSMFPIGITTNTFQVIDLFGNQATCAFTVTVHDTELPGISCPADITLTNDSGQCGAVVNFTVIREHDCPGAITMQIAGLGSGELFPLGATTNTWKIVDVLGNSATCGFVVTVIDGETPQLLCPADIIVTNETGRCGSVVNYTLNRQHDCGGAAIAQTEGLASGALFPVGSTTNSFLLTDASGHTASCSFQVQVVDGTVPELLCPPDITVTNSPGLCIVQVDFPAPFGADDCAGVMTSQTGGLPSGSFFPIGFTTNTYQAIDAAGNRATCSFVVWVVDSETPQIFCPADITVTNSPGQCGTVVQYNITRAHSCAATILVQNSGLGSGATFPVGITTNAFQLIDASGNSATCSFAVTVLDMEEPLIACPSDLILTNDPGQCGAVANFQIPQPADNCPGATTSLINGLMSGSLFPIGTTTNAFEAVDRSGNRASCAFTVTVQDSEPPRLFCPPDLTVTNDPGACGATVLFPVITEDNCPGAIVSQIEGMTNGSFFPLGDTTNAFEVVDSSGNRATCGFLVRVIDAEAPALVCPMDITVTNEPGQCGAIVGFETPTAADNCSEATVLQIAGLSSGSMFPTGETTNTFQASDLLGNTINCSFLVRVVDAEPPQILCPTDIILTNDPGQCGTISDWSMSAPSDNCDSNAVVTCLPPAGSFLPIGTNIIECTAIDQFGNQSHCSFTVTVQSVTIPTLQITYSGLDVLLRWTNPCVPWLLEESPSLNAPTVWEPAQGELIPSNNELQFRSAGATNTMRYFRLRRLP